MNSPASLGVVDGVIIGGFIAYALYSGLRARRVASQNLVEYFLAGRTLSGFKAGISMAATQFAADTPLLVTGLIATAGIFSLWRLWIYALAFLLMGFVLAPAWRRAGVLTDAELTELRYGARPAAVLRGVKAVYFGAIFNCTVLAMVLWAAKEIAEPFLVWHTWLPAGVYDPLRSAVAAIGIPFARADAAGDVWLRSTDNAISLGALLLLTTLYSTTGGLRSVVQTDVVQFIVMMIGTLLYAIWVVRGVGGLDALEQALRLQFGTAGGESASGISADQILAFTPGHARDASLVVVAVILVQWLVQMNADGTGYLAQRSMACRSDRDATVAAVVFTVAQVLLRSLFWLPIGLGLLVLFPPAQGLSTDQFTADREATFVLGIKQLLPPGLLGLMLTGMLAALASTVDTHLNWGSSYFTNDIYQRFICEGWRQRKPSPQTLVWVARSCNILILLLALLIMTQLSSIQRAWHISLLLGAGMGVTLVLRWLWWRVSAWGEIACIVASILLAPLLLAGLPDSEAARLLLMALGATAAGVGGSLLAGPESNATLQAFYRRALPPGFWEPVAAALGESVTAPRRRLGRGLSSMLLAACSVFCLLTGLGSWLVGSPPPSWTPGRPYWITALLALGLGLVPWWWRLGLARQPTPSRSEGNRDPAV